MTEELKPCPFCGGEVGVDYSDFNRFYEICCSNLDCIAIVSIDHKEKSKAIKAWNTRVSDN